MDIEVNSVTSSEDMMERLNRASVPGIEIVSVKELPEKAGNAMASVAAADYTVLFREGRAPHFDYQSKLADFLAKDQILVTKETKRGTHEVDLKPGIYEMSLCENGFRMLVDASSAGNIKPGMVISAFLADYGEELTENALLITREDTYTNLGSEEKPKLVPLDAVGKDIV